MPTDKKKADGAKASEPTAEEVSAETAPADVVVTGTGNPVEPTRNSGEYSSPLSTNEALQAASDEAAKE